MILVGYASRFGSTREIAERIASRLREPGNGVDVRPVSEVRGLTSYDAVVLGSPVYNGSWLPDAIDFARRERDGLASRRLWLFSVGSFGDQHRVIGSLMKREPKEIRGLLDATHPRDYRVFAGVIERERWSAIGGWILRIFGGRFGDNRDWPGIDAWADTIARDLRTAGAPVS